MQKDYICPICIVANGTENDNSWIVQDDIVYKDNHVFAFISSKEIKGNPGHVLISPLDHYENLYDIPEDLGGKVFALSKRIAKALKSTRDCTGITILQCNEPDGGQHAFHYHLHVIPRFPDDNFTKELWKATRCEAQSRKLYAKKIRNYLNT